MKVGTLYILYMLYSGRAPKPPSAQFSRQFSKLSWLAKATQRERNEAGRRKPVERPKERDRRDDQKRLQTFSRPSHRGIMHVSPISQAIDTKSSGGVAGSSSEGYSK
ncbi:hypothetical protein [Rhodoblastus sp.]|uniref:hypothetical protein n=1 Tax=Rhodoblastus sp. TaxID=1962975 RepID=UPI003F9CABA3